VRTSNPAFVLSFLVSWDSSVGTVTRYRLDGPGIETQWGQDFPHLSRPAHPTSYTMGTGFVLGVERPGHDTDNLLPSSTKVKETVQLYLYSPSGPSRTVLGWALPFPSFLREETYVSHPYRTGALITNMQPKKWRYMLLLADMSLARNSLCCDYNVAMCLLSSFI
jgi:hypothetical protein